MPESTVYLEKITEFTRLLRREGLSVGSAEQQSAVQLLQLLELEDRTTVRDALRSILAKTQKEQSRFDAVFDSYFVSSEQKRAAAKEMGEAEAELARRRSELDETLNVNGREIPLREDIREQFIHLPEEEQEKLKNRVSRYRDSMERHPSLYDNFIQSIFLRTVMEQQLLAEDAGVGNTDDPDADLLYRSITSFSEAELQRAVELIRRIADKINGELTAKHRNGGNSGPLNFRATIRKGLETGGVLNRLRYRKKRERRRRLVMLCDVSGSMMQFSEFVLRFMKAVSDSVDHSSIYLFSEGISRVDPFALQNMDGFSTYVRHSGCFGKGTDLGQALNRLLAVKPSVFTSSTIFLILTDTKTVDVYGADEVLKRIRHITGKTVLLCPIPKDKWQYINGCRVFSGDCDMLPCSTIEELASACTRLFA